MKKLLCLLLAAAMLLALCACGGKQEQPAPSAAPDETPAPAPEQDGENAPDTVEAVPLPALGDTVEGFTVRELREFPLVGATLVRFEHERTGAQVLYIANSDTNRVYDLTFRTRAIDNTGLPHVFEHATLDGSEKYPSKALFFNLSYQTYNTYMNAMTGALYTTYPVASLSEAQLLCYADYYTDSCFHPMILEDESIFREEAWRYRLADADDELTIEGTVYSEMQGALDLTGSAYNNILRAAFPGSTIGNESGGEPAHIPEMTWESLRSYHDLYYHPSNCTAFLYGKFNDYTAFLELLDEAFKPYEKREFSFADEGWEPLTESVETSVAFPVEAGSSTENASAIYYAFACPGLKDDPQQELILNTLTDLMVADGSPLMRSLKRALPSGRFATYIELDGPEDMIVFYADGVNAEDAQIFKETVDAALAEMAENGFSAELVDGIMASLALSTKLTGESSDIGVDLISSFISYYASTEDLFGYPAYTEALDQIENWNAQGLYTKAISDWLLSGGVTVLCTTYPEPGLREALDTAEAERLAGVKAAMSEDEIAAIVAQTAAEDEEDDAAAYVKQLQAVTVGSLPEEVRTYEVNDRTGDDGVRYIEVAADVDGVGDTLLLLDASALPQEDIHWFALYTALLGEMDTEKHSRDELSLLMSRYFYNGELRLSLMDDAETGDYRPYLRASWIAEDDDLGTGYDLMYELLYETDFGDSETLLGVISRAKTALKASITADPYSPMVYRMFGYYSPLYRYYSYFNGIEFYAFLEEAERLAQEDPAAVSAKLGEIRDYFHNRSGAVAVYAGSEAGVKTNAALVKAFMAKLDDTPRSAAVYSLPAPARSEALIIDSSVQYNGVLADYETMGMEGYSGDLDAVSSALSDAYLYPALRDQYGAYGVLTGFVEDAGAYVISYRDPNVRETFAVYDAIADFVGDLDLEQEELDGYILSSYSVYAKATGELSGAIDAAIDTLTGDGQTLPLDYMRELKALTPDKLRGYADAYGALVTDGLRFTAGSASAINANADLYDAILNPFGAVDSTEIELEDVPEDSEHYEAVRFVFENGLMDALDAALFGVDETATVGDLAIALYVLVFDGDADGQTAIDTFAEYGVTNGSEKADDALTGKAADSLLANFSEAVGVGYTKNAQAGAETLTRGELAEIITAYCDSLFG